MVLIDILTILQSDSELQSLLEGTTEDKKIYGFSTTKLKSIVYDYVDLTSNKIVGQARLTLTINTLKVDYSLNMQIISKVKQLLLTLGDKQLNNDILTVEQNGGGMLENQEASTIHNKIIFTIKYKERN